MKIVTGSQMRAIEQACAGAGLPPDALMENAGLAVAENIRHLLGELSGQTILFLIGPGNNGGDGLVAARHFHDWGASVCLFLAGPRPDDANMFEVSRRHIPAVALSDLSPQLTETACVVDALFGTGKLRPFTGSIAEALGRVVASRLEREFKVVAIDMPSGMDADTGQADPATLSADLTVTLGLPKWGHLRFPGAALCGRLFVADIGIPETLTRQLGAELMTDAWARNTLPERPVSAHKGSFGKLMVLAGSPNYVGAAYLACSGAMRVGAGLVSLASAASLHPVVAAKLTEATHLPLPETSLGILSGVAGVEVLSNLDGYNALLAGCGMGRSPGTASFLSSILFSGRELPALVLDADALNILAETPDWWQRLPHDAVLTPHPGEMARLCGTSLEDVQSDREELAAEMSRRWGKTVILKGAFTVVAAPDGRLRINPAANPALATAGTGDVMAGAVAGFLVQGLGLFEAACLGSYVFSCAGESVRQSLGEAGVVASDLLPELPRAIKAIKKGRGV